MFISGAFGDPEVPGMMTLISLAISVAFVFSLAVTFGYPGIGYSGTSSRRSS